MNSLRVKKDDIIRHPINEPSLLSGTALAADSQVVATGTVANLLNDWQSLNHSSPKMRAERAQLKSCKDDKTIAQGKRGTSAALGYEPKMISLFFPIWFGAPGRAKPDWKKRDWVCGGVYPGRRPRRPCPGLLSCRPSRGSGGHMNGGRGREIGHHLANHRLQARPGFATPFGLSLPPGLPEPKRSRCRRSLRVTDSPRPCK